MPGIIRRGMRPGTEMFLNSDGRLTETSVKLSTVGDREGPAADGRQFHGRHQQTIGPSRAEGTSTRQIGDTNQLFSFECCAVQNCGHLQSNI